MLEAISREVQIGCNEELLYASDLILVRQPLEGLKVRLGDRKGALKSKGLRANVKQTKTMISSDNYDEKVSKEGKCPCAVSQKGVDSNLTLCQSWANNKCSGITCKMKGDSKFKCQACATQQTNVILQ